MKFLAGMCVGLLLAQGIVKYAQMQNDRRAVESATPTPMYQPAPTAPRQGVRDLPEWMRMPTKLDQPAKPVRRDQ